MSRPFPDQARVPVLVAGLLGALLSLWITDSPGFTQDEAHLIEPAWQLATTGTMNCPALGPGHGHERAWVYQAPLHVALAGALLKILPLSLWTVRLLSLVLATLCGILIALLAVRLKARALATSFGVVVLMCDPLFVGRAREFRYDFLGMAFFLVGLLLATGRRGGFLAGVAAGLATSSYVGYAVLAPVALVWGALRRRGKQRLLWSAKWALGGVAGLVPLVYRFLRYWPEFQEQFLWQARALAARPEGVTANLLAEADKFVQLYKLAPLFPVIAALALAALFAWGRAGRGRFGRESLRVAAVAALVLLVIGLCSGHRRAHHLVCVPLLALAAALAAEHALRRRWFGGRSLAAVTAGLAILGAGPRVYAAFVSRGTRDPGMFDERLAKVIPAGSRVNGYYTFWFTARRLEWEFTMDAFGRDSTQAIVASTPDFLIESGDGPSRVRLAKPDEWVQLDRLETTVSAARSAPLQGRLTNFTVYRRAN